MVVFGAAGEDFAVLSGAGKTHRLFIGNVPKGLSEEELTNIIKGKGPGVVNIERFKVCFVVLCLSSSVQSMSSGFTNGEMLLHRISMTRTVIVASSLLSIITAPAQNMPGRSFHHEASRLMGAN